GVERELPNVSARSLPSPAFVPTPMQGVKTEGEATMSEIVLQPPAVLDEGGDEWLCLDGNWSEGSEGGDREGDAGGREGAVADTIVGTTDLKDKGKNVVEEPPIVIDPTKLTFVPPLSSTSGPPVWMT